MNKFKVSVYGFSLAVLAFLSCNTQSQFNNKKVDLKVETDSVSYAVGISIGKSIANDFKMKGLDTIFDADIVTKGISDMLNGNETQIDERTAYSVVDKYMKKINSSQQQKIDDQSKRTLEEGKKFLEENRQKEGVVELQSGLQYIVLHEGQGTSPGINDRVTVHYHGTLLDGTVFDSSVERGEPIQFAVNGVIKGWVEALQLMKPGSKWKLFVPSELAYGNRSNGSIPPNSVLIFEVELISVNK